MGTFGVVTAETPATSGPVLAVASNKGGVGKTTLVANLAIYLRALHDELAIAVLSLDDQGVLDRMFDLGTPHPGEGNLKHGWAERSFERLLRLGQYGIHFVPSSPDTAPLKARAEEIRTLRRILDRTEWEGLTLVDTKSDLEALTQNALYAADRVLVPVSDWASLEEAAKLLAILDRTGRGRERARLLLTLVDRRTRVTERGLDLAERLWGEIRSRRWPRYETWLSRSPRVEALNSQERHPLSILHHAQGTLVHREMRELAREVSRDLRLAGGEGLLRLPASGERVASGAPAWKTALLRGWRRP
jgi:cellulose biosynthesis protein BcsQ